MPFVIIAVIIYLVALFVFANALSDKKSNRNLNSASSNINNINETNRYKIKNNIYE